MVVLFHGKRWAVTWSPYEWWVGCQLAEPEGRQPAQVGIGFGFGLVVVIVLGAWAEGVDWWED